MLLYIKALHIFAMTAWFAGLWYLPRLFVYHAECEDAAGRARFTRMETRLYWGIMLPAMLLTLLFGLILMSHGFSGRWLLIKLGVVGLLIAFHCSLFYYMKKLAGGAHPSARFFRWYNEAPTLLLLAILYLAVVKPL